ncbi:hypothetical protein EI94DRAFT_1704760 [Lactarius quietus]|nr:hypothetical protein EI94DRAFT_1704760 [Lactarius quietus]
MAPTKKKTKTAAAGTFAALFPSDWSDHSSDKSHYSSNDQNDDSESSSDDSDSSTDGLSIASGDVQTATEGHAVTGPKPPKLPGLVLPMPKAKGPPMVMPVKNIWLTDEQASMVQTQVADFRAGDIATRIDIIQDCVEQLRRSWRHDVDFDRNVVETKWTFSDIVIDVHHEELDKMAAEMSGCKAGSPAYLRCYKKALKIIEDRMDDDDKVKYQADAKKWTEHKLPPRQQLRQIALKEFSESMYLQFGMRVAILGGIAKPKANQRSYCIGTSFKECNKEWMNDPLIKDFSRWTAESFGVQPNNEGQDDGGRNKEKMPNIKLPIDSRGYPVLPSWEAINNEGLTYKKMLIGKFMKDADSLLKHWTQRQAAGEVPLWFRKVEKAGLRRTQSSASGNTSDPVVPSAQEQGSRGESQGDGDDLPGQAPDGEGQGDVTGDVRT